MITPLYNLLSISQLRPHAADPMFISWLLNGTVDALDILATADAIPFFLFLHTTPPIVITSLSYLIATIFIYFIFYL